jgi:hypothetical protein
VRQGWIPLNSPCGQQHHVVCTYGDKVLTLPLPRLLEERKPNDMTRDWCNHKLVGSWPDDSPAPSLFPSSNSALCMMCTITAKMNGHWQSAADKNTSCLSCNK